MLSTPLDILLASWDLVVAAAPYLLGGFAIAGVMKALLPDDLVVKVLVPIMWEIQLYCFHILHQNFYKVVILSVL